MRCVTELPAPVPSTRASSPPVEQCLAASLRDAGDRPHRRRAAEGAFDLARREPRLALLHLAAASRARCPAILKVCCVGVERGEALLRARRRAGGFSKPTSSAPAAATSFVREQLALGGRHDLGQRPDERRHVVAQRLLQRRSRSSPRAPGPASPCVSKITLPLAMKVSTSVKPASAKWPRSVVHLDDAAADVDGAQEGDVARHRVQTVQMSLKARLEVAADHLLDDSGGMPLGGEPLGDQLQPARLVQIGDVERTVFVGRLDAAALRGPRRRRARPSRYSGDLLDRRHAHVAADADVILAAHLERVLDVPDHGVAGRRLASGPRHPPRNGIR